MLPRNSTTKETINGNTDGFAKNLSTGKVNSLLQDVHFNLMFSPERMASSTRVGAKVLKVNSRLHCVQAV